jgi:hypothetical protein
VRRIEEGDAREEFEAELEQAEDEEEGVFE